MNKLTNRLNLLAILCFLIFGLYGCEQKKENKEVEKPEYFLLRPDVEKAYGYSHAVKIGNSIKISGAVSMDDQGNPTAVVDI